MQVLHLFTKLRADIAQTERAIVRAWQRYARELSTPALAEAEAATKHLAALHRRLARRLGQLAGEGRRWGARPRSSPPSAPAAAAPGQPPRRSA